MCHRRRNEGGRECANHPAGQPSGSTNTVDPASTVAHRRQKPPAAVVVRTPLAMDFTTDSSQPNSAPSPSQTNAVKQHSRFPLASKISPPNQSSRSAFLTSLRPGEKKKKKKFSTVFASVLFAVLFHHSTIDRGQSLLIRISEGWWGGGRVVWEVNFIWSYFILFLGCVWRKGEGGNNLFLF